ncbi:hypothetical protein PRECH8_15160 [Insulibacter thermoxylanivorax]|uniref:DUF2326 domain-containing protein n=1 Tax=Insulibacter thermoxylanivorax TaxID=2749268 RepID=A0A916QCW5_9BACL|nr:DUF2326 domain-containing protein [Insulibacter thermoxylanivorax]GFR38220.1 hypothetical protein PRECH8_15160 [Insulibacter thermoxylanivorax]
MLIERLIVRKTVPTIEVIRDIRFNAKGLSLILDNTSNRSQDTGNNVGKTTALKIIDLCLGGKSVRSLYYDPDTRSENTDIKKLLNDYKIEAELVLRRESKKVRIIRQLYNRGKRIINGKEYPQEEFWEKLKEIIFDLKEPYPTLRQLIPKFVRLNDSTDESIITFLPNTSADTYDTIYLFLLNILSNDLLSEKDILSNRLKECENKQKLLEKDENISSLDSLKQKYQLVEKELAELIEKRKHLNYIDTYKEELEKRRTLASKLNLLEEKLQLLEFEISYFNKSISKLENEKSNIDLRQLQHLYSEAKAYVNDIDKTFDALVNFHNTMIQNRIDFIKTQLETKTQEFDTLLSQRDQVLEEKKRLTIEVLDEGLLEELNVLNTKIEKLNVEKGEINQSIKIMEGVNNEIKELSEKVKKISEQMEPDNITKKVTKFNEYFSAYCEKLYGEKYWFVYDRDWKKKKKFPVMLDWFKGRVGTGMKKGVIVAFDLAYMKFAHEIGIKVPQFVIHDKLENTHINQLKSIFELCNEIEGQYIIPILRERVGKVDQNILESAKVLELSSDNKFFRLN